MLNIKFTGILNDQMAGFYRSSYVVNGKIKYMASTKFEPTHARKAFPCWDEPNIKTVYDISVITDNYMEVISNMNISEKRTINEEKTVYIYIIYVYIYSIGNLHQLHLCPVI